MSSLLMLLTATLVGPGGGAARCNQDCNWNAFTHRFDCDPGTTGRDCISWGDSCAIITSCSFSLYIETPGGRLVGRAEVNGCKALAHSLTGPLE